MVDPDQRDWLYQEELERQRMIRRMQSATPGYTAYSNPLVLSAFLIVLVGLAIYIGYEDVIDALRSLRDRLDRSE